MVGVVGATLAGREHPSARLECGMDVPHVRTYIEQVKLLLLLSALLSALTGVQAGARAPQLAMAVSQAAAPAATSRVASVAPSGRPVFALPALAEQARSASALRWRLAAAVPLYASRRRE